MKKTIGQATAYDVDGAAEALDLVPETIRTMIRDGRLPAHKVGRKWWVTEETLEAALEGRLPRQQAKGDQ